MHACLTSVTAQSVVPSLMAHTVQTSVLMSLCMTLAGEAKVHECLRTNLDKISDACRKEEISLSVLQASNTELMPNIANACKVCLLPLPPSSKACRVHKVQTWHEARCRIQDSACVD